MGGAIERGGTAPWVTGASAAAGVGARTACAGSDPNASEPSAEPGCAGSSAEWRAMYS